METQTVWVGVASLIRLSGSDFEREGLVGGYGFVAIRASDIEEAVGLLSSELAEGGSLLVGFEWLSRLEDYDQELSQENVVLIQKLDDYPVQFHRFHWHSEDTKPN